MKVPQDFAALVQSHVRYGQGGYSFAGDEGWATDTYRLHWQGPAEQMPEKYRSVVPVGLEATPLPVSKGLLAWLRLAVKIGKRRRAPLRITDRWSMDLFGNSDFDILAMCFEETPPVALPERVGINPEYFLDALRFVSRGKYKGVTFTVPDGLRPVMLECRDRHAVIMPMRCSS